jgi:hypothetical protein
MHVADSDRNRTQTTRGPTGLEQGQEAMSGDYSSNLTIFGPVPM